MPKRGGIRNLGRAKFKLDILSNSMLGILAKELFGEAETIMTESKEKYVPVDKGPLRASGSVDLPKITVNKVSVQLGFGNPFANYALFVHEDMTARHPIGQAKFLEVPFKSALSGMPKRIATALRRAAKRVV